MLQTKVTGLYVGCATLGAMVWWFHDHGVSLKQMMGQPSCTAGSSFAATLVLGGADLPLLGVDAAADPCAIFHGPVAKAKVHGV